jgi:hypothetical protein
MQPSSSMPHWGGFVVVPHSQESTGKKASIPGTSLGMVFVLFSDSKGALLMTLLPLADCCQLLTIDPKTLRRWARNSSMALTTHPADARVKCLTKEQVRHLAAVHNRSMALSEARTPSPLAESPQTPTQPHLPELHTPASQAETNLLEKLSSLETQVATLQQHLAQLTLELLQERTQRYEQRLQTLEALIPPPGRQAVPSPALQAMSGQLPQEEADRKERCLHPAELRARSRVIPLIEYGAGGTYVVICPQQGELPLTPDSPEWFNWLATLSSFRFVGQQGRFTAYRKGRTSRGWSAYRTIHQQDYKHYLGTTDHLTIDCLEQMAARLQSHLASL